MIACGGVLATNKPPRQWPLQGQGWDRPQPPSQLKCPRQ